MTVTPAAGALPFAEIGWTGIGMCGPRIGSTGQGGFRTTGPDGRAVSFTGPGDGAAGGSAMVNATFYGVDEAVARPAGVAGVLLIQGDSGVISGIFAANAIGAVSFQIGSDVGRANKVFAATELNVLQRNPNVDARTKDLLAYYQRRIRHDPSAVDFGFISA